MKKSNWKNCYSEQWAGILVPAAFAHPAKISLALVRKIFTHARKNGWVKKGETCLDPFAGIGGVAFGAMAAGLNFVGQELEPHFVELANGMECTGISKADWVRFYGRWEKANRRDGRHWCADCLAQAKEIVEPIAKTEDLFGSPATAAYKQNSGKIPSTLPHPFEGNIEFWRRKFGVSGAVIVQGDSRQLLQNFQGQVECVVSSPPYETAGLGHRGKPNEIDFKKKLYSRIANSQYGDLQNNLGNLPAGSFDAVVSSPPYLRSVHDGNGIDAGKLKKKNPGNNSQVFAEGYGESAAQLGAMAEGSFDIAVSSPPYEGTPINQTHMTSNRRGDINNRNYRPSWKKKLSDGYEKTKRPYGQSDGQIGESCGETFWSAAREIVEQCFLALKPGGHAIWVTKRFVRNGEIVEFSKQWAKLCEAVGFKVVCWHHAMLTESGAIQMNIEGEETQRFKERKSFFRRLAEKNGSPRIDWEDVICMVKPKNAL